MGKYRGNPEAIAALVGDDCVHRDVYLSEELFELEQEFLFARTWNYLCHDSQIPNTGDYFTANIAGRPLMAVRHTDGSVRVMMNRCAHKGAKLAPEECGNTGKFFRCPYHAWTFKTDGSLLSIPFKKGYEGTRTQRMPDRQGAGDHRQCPQLPRLHLRARQRRRPGLRGVLRAGDHLPGQHGRPRPRARSRSPAGACGTCTTATGRCSSRTSTTPCTR
ncbi:MAG: Rieske 2Fe-2S domain-containing protein [Arhodomonas sp.]|nr:Rieske 2Fe-2S domain-containing protein [Arhodomonas sp.]